VEVCWFCKEMGMLGPHASGVLSSGVTSKVRKAGEVPPSHSHPLQPGDRGPLQIKEEDETR
jgi:hypothetical protein